MTVAELIRELQKIKNPENIKIIKWNIDYGWGEITQVKVETDCDGENRMRNPYAYLLHCSRYLEEQKKKNKK